MINNLNNLSEREQNHLIAQKLGRERLIDFAVVTDNRYQVNWHHGVVANELQEAYEAVKRGERVRIILELPPRHGKSELSTIKFPAYVLGKSPEYPIIVVSYAQDLASDFGLMTKDLMNSRNYQALFQTRLREDSQAKAKWLTEAGGGYTAVGVGGPITGKGFKLGIVDDPFKNREEADSQVVRDSKWKWYRSTFLTREEGNGAIIVIMTRWHDDDIVGRILNSEGAKEWKVIKLPAIAEKNEEYRKKGDPLWPEKFSLDILQNRRNALGPYEWSALYQQDPVDEGAREFKKEWIKYRSLEEVLKLDTRRFITIDPASALRDKSDFIGVVVNYIDQENKWNIASYKLKVNSMELIRFMFKLNSEIKPERFGIEQGAYKDAIKPFLDDEMRKRNEFFEVVELKHQAQSKVIRIRGLIPRYSSGSVYHIEGMCADLEEEQARFPKGVNDDVLDAEAYQNQIIEEYQKKKAYQQKSYQPQSEYEGGEPYRPTTVPDLGNW